MRRNWTLFPPEMLDEIVRTNLTSPGTALRTTKDYVQLIWPKFENAMKTNKSLVFARGHNFKLPQDPSMPPFKDGVVIVNPSYAALVARRTYALFSSGMWDFWRAQAEAKKSQGTNSSVHHLVDEFTPLTMNHDLLPV